MNNLKDKPELTALKASIGFGTAVKVTLGFYVGQWIATILGLGILFSVLLFINYLTRG